MTDVPRYGEPLRNEDFKEFSPEELIKAIERLGPELDVVEVEVQDPQGNVIDRDLVRFHVGYGHDFDRVGGYTWAKITARQEPR